MPIGHNDAGASGKTSKSELSAPAAPPDAREHLDKAPAELPARPAAGPTSSASVVSFDIPLRITVSLGEAGGQIALQRVTPSHERAELLVEKLSPEDYADRAGYDRRFLGAEVPLPTIKAKTRFGSLLRVPRPAKPKDINELRYHHYSVLMNQKRRLAYVSACNVDFNAEAKVSRDEGTGSWRLDPRLDPEQQLGAAFYGDNDYDKGHLTRRDDAAWGRDDDEALASNNDTFHYTNAAPQHFLLNRSTNFTGANLDLWGDLENFISEQGDDQRTRLSIFNGPIFGTHDKPLRGALAPLAFFKIAIWRDGKQNPGAVGFVLEQADLIKGLPEEAIDPGRFKIRQRRISAIEDLLDISFGPVTDFDVLAHAEADEAIGSDDIEITRRTDIRLPRRPR